MYSFVWNKQLYKTERDGRCFRAHSATPYYDIIGVIQSTIMQLITIGGHSRWAVCRRQDLCIEKRPGVHSCPSRAVDTKGPRVSSINNIWEVTWVKFTRRHLETSCIVLHDLANDRVFDTSTKVLANMPHALNTSDWPPAGWLFWVSGWGTKILTCNCENRDNFNEKGFT